MDEMDGMMSIPARQSSNRKEKRRAEKNGEARVAEGKGWGVEIKRRLGHGAMFVWTLVEATILKSHV